jgi:hypothetical protein
MVLLSNCAGVQPPSIGNIRAAARIHIFMLP